MASLSQKIMGASIGAALLCAAAAGAGLWVAVSLSHALDRSAASSRVLRLHMHADMMHDALRGDVSGAIMSTDPSLGVDIKQVRADLAEHVGAFETDIKEGRALAQDPATQAALDQVAAPLQTYIATAGKLIGLASDDPAAAKAMLPEFNRQFSALETALEEASQKIEAAAQAEIGRAHV